MTLLQVTCLTWSAVRTTRISWLFGTEKAAKRSLQSINIIECYIIHCTEYLIYELLLLIIISCRKKKKLIKTVGEAIRNSDSYLIWLSAWRAEIRGSFGTALQKVSRSLYDMMILRISHPKTLRGFVSFSYQQSQSFFFKKINRDLDLAFSVSLSMIYFAVL